MDVIYSLPIVLFVMLGLGAWLPVPGAGIRFAAGGGLLVLGLFLVHFVLGLSLSVAPWLFVGIAAAGCVVGILRYRRALDVPGLIIHPLIALPVFAFLVGAMNDHGSYIVYSWDEFSNWLYWAREAWLLDTIRAPGMFWQNMAYPQGLPLALAFPNLFFDTYENSRSLVVQFLWHVGLLALFYDVVTRIMSRSFEFDIATARIIAWLFILGSLALEVTWTLVPQFLLSEKPQIYFLAGTIGLVLLALFDADYRQNTWFLISIGLVASVGYLLKPSYIVFVPILTLFALVVAWQSRLKWSGIASIINKRTISTFLLILGPFVLVYFGWAGFLPFEKRGGCTADPLIVLHTLPQLWTDHETVVAPFFSALGSYLVSFKPQLTVIALIGIAVAFCDRRAAPVGFGLVLYAFGYVLALLVLYSACFSPYESAALSSFRRYTRVVLRLIHLVGPLLFIIVALRILDKYWYNITRNVMKLRSVRIVLISGISVLLVYQGVVLDRAMRNVAERHLETPDTLARIVNLKLEATALKSLIKTLPMENPRVALVAQKTDGYELVQARYRALKYRRGSHPTVYKLSPPYSWGPSSENIWMNKIHRDGLRAHLMSFEIIWPFITDAWISPILSELANTGHCRSNATDYFFIATGQAEKPFHCIPKTSR